ncbi:hypothetical protein MSP8887_03707 [Marinomonas spartinae]|uniref:hypothetical protein n=1 Tax=Marinomonas spartinae TaxID=1792290 RepID=UPI00080908D8|nr:hypothetical protein [Marinomonas spartinae]SBS39206.1 hypothetical protein MSP8887_03707 [Marinomonas spartinae]
MSIDKNINDLLFVLQQRNLVYNHKFLYFSNQTGITLIEYNHPDGWIYQDDGQGSQITLSDNTCRITTSNDDTNKMIFKQNLHEFPRWKDVLLEKRITCKALMHVEGQCDLSFRISDGITSNVETITCNSTAVAFNVNITVSEQAQCLFVELSTSSKSVVIAIQTIFANIGEFAMESLPCMVEGVIGERKQYIATEVAPAEELSLCANPPIELTSDYSRLNSVLNYRFGKKNENSLLPDIRGYFSRCWNNGATIDKDASEREMAGEPTKKGDFVGTLEEGIFKSHLHDLAFSPQSIVLGKESPGTGLNIAKPGKTELQGGKETRPVNIAELYTIKWS